MLLHQRRQLGAEAAGARGLVHDHAAAGLLHRGDQRLQVQRPQAAQVDDLGIDAGLARGRFADEDHGAVADHRQVGAGAEHRGRLQRHRVVALGHLAQRMGRPGHQRPVVVAVEGAVVQPLGLQEDDRVVVLDRGDQQALGIARIGRHHRAQPADVREQRLRALAVRLAAVDAAAAGHADGDRRGEVARRAVAQARRLRHDLVVGRIDVVGELHLHHRAQAVGAHADGRADDAALVDRRIEHARAAVLGLQAFGAAEHAAEVAHVLAVDDHVVVALQHHVHGGAQGLDHRHRGHGRHPSDASCSRWRFRCSGMSL
ncbi:hypothetical protein D3C72_1181320 [compost metagenome]